jgi:hypothetical protein
MLALKDKCVHPESQKTYIKSFSGGKNNSPEGFAVCDMNTFSSRILMYFIGPTYAWFRS